MVRVFGYHSVMPSVGIHPDTDVPTRDHQRPSDACAGRTVAAVTAEIDELSDRLEELGVELAGLVRDGADDLAGNQ